MKYIIGVDCGTTNVKAVLFDEFGRELMIRAKENRPEYSGASLAELDMDVTWRKTAACIRELLESGPADSKAVAAVGVTGQGEGLWLVDEAGKPLQNAILWCDARATKEVAAVLGIEPAVGRMIHAVTGTMPVEGTQLMLLKWMADNRKPVLDRAAAAFFCKDWIRYKLSGQIAADFTDSGTSLLNIRTGAVADGLLNILGLGAYRHILPDPVPSDEFCAAVSEAAAAETGLRAGTPILAGGVDVSVSALGLGAVNEDDRCLIIGTTCAAMTVRRQENCQFGAEGTRYERHPLASLYIALNPSMNGTANIDWAMREIAGTDNFQAVRRLAASVPPGAGGVLYLPYIGLAGERSPFHSPHARAGFFGVDIHSTKASLVRAVYEGIALSVRDCFGEIGRHGVLYLAGGGAQDAVLAQIIADFMNEKVRIPDAKELGAKGICLMALVRLGIFSSYEEAAVRCCKYRTEYGPEIRNVKKYDRIYELFRSVREAHMPLWDARAEVLRAL